MSVEYYSFLYFKQVLTDVQIEEILKLDCKLWLTYGYNSSCGNIVSNLLWTEPCFAMSEIHFCSDDGIRKLHKYDKDGYWPTYFMVNSDNILNINNTLIPFIIARYIYTKWKIESYCFIEVYSNGVHFIYNASGLTVNKGFKEHIGEQHLHPISRNDLVFNYSSREYEGIKHTFQNLNAANKITSYDTRDSHDIVIHIFAKGDGYIIRKFTNCNGNPAYYLAKKPLNNPRLIEFECEGPAQRFIEYSNWQYQLTASSITPTVTETYRADKIWYDVILIDIIKKAYYSEDEIIVTSSTGEIIFMMKNKELVIDNKWQDYFSIFPIIPKDYKVEDITNI